MSGARGWSIQQLVEFLAAVSSREDARASMHSAVERAAEALEAEVGALVADGRVVTSVGFGAGEVPEAVLARAVADGADTIELPGLGACAAATATVPGETGTVVVARQGDEGFSREEVNLLRGMARVLSMTLGSLRLLEEERRLVASLDQQRRLHAQLARIEEAIATGARFDEVVDVVVSGAAELTGDELGLMRMIDADDPGLTVIVATRGFELAGPRRAPAAVGIGGQAIAEGRLVVAEDVAMPSTSLGGLARSGMAVPVHEHGAIIGCLAVGTANAARRYSEGERELLTSYAEHASLALAAAKAVDAMRHAYTDFLTGLANRALFVERLERALDAARLREDEVTILFLDVDRFKRINDRLGHLAGDELLVAVARRLEGCLTGRETVARLGGDEFAILLENASGPRVAQRVIDALRAPVRVQGHDVSVSASIGIASGRCEEADELLRRADEAMYHAKRRGKGRYEVFEPGMRAEAAERLELEADLQRALERGEFHLQYQPIVDLATGRTVGVEALVRLRHPERGMLPPAVFIPLAEETGLILDLGRWVLEEACRQAAAWQAEHPRSEPLLVSVNLSGSQLYHGRIVEEVERALVVSGLAPGSLILEITETVLMQDTEAVVTRLAELRQLGVRLAIDDFGTGYSSLGYLERFPIDILKVAKPFVDGLASGAVESPIARAIVSLAGALGLNTIGEGIEEGSQRERLRALGCALGQGYHYARPLEPEDLAARLREEDARQDEAGPGLAWAA